VNADTKTTGALADHGAVLEGVVDTLNRVVLHTDKEARAELRLRRTSVEKGGCRVSKVALGHEVVRLDNAVEVVAVDANGDTHDEVLGPLGDLAVQTEEIRAFERFESEAGLHSAYDKSDRRGDPQVVVEVAVVDDSGIQSRSVGHDDVIGLLCDERRRTTSLGVN
jgi:hypothetical protein